MAKDSRGGKRNTGTITTGSGTYTYDQLKKRNDTIKKLYLDYWDGKMDVFELRNKTEQLLERGEVTRAELENLQYEASREYDRRAKNQAQPTEKALQSRDNFKAFIKDQFKGVNGVNKITIAKETKQGNWGVYIQGKEKLNSRNRIVQYKTYIGAYENGKPMSMSNINFAIELAKNEMELFYKK